MNTDMQKEIEQLIAMPDAERGEYLKAQSSDFLSELLCFLLLSLPQQRLITLLIEAKAEGLSFVDDIAKALSVELDSSEKE